MADWLFRAFLTIAISCAVAIPADAGGVSPRLLALLHHELTSDGEPLPGHARIKSLSVGRAGILHLVHWRYPYACGNGGGCSLEIFRERGGRVEFIGNIPIVVSVIAILPGRTGHLPDLMVNRWRNPQVFSRIAYNGWRYRPVWNKRPDAFPGKKLPGRVVISPRTPITTVG